MSSPPRMLIAALLLPLLLVACGGSNTPADSPDPTPDQAADQATADAPPHEPQQTDESAQPDTPAAQPDDPAGQTSDSILDDPRLQLFDNDLTLPSQPHLPNGAPHQYDSDPPYGGPHGATPAACGIFQEPIAATALVHTMEHGAVVLYLNPDLATGDAAAQLDALAQEFLDAGRRIVLVPSPTIDTAIVLAAWGVLLPLDTAAPDTIRAFVAAFEDNAPERIPREFAC